MRGDLTWMAGALGVAGKRLLFHSSRRVSGSHPWERRCGWRLLMAGGGYLPVGRMQAD